MDFARAFRETLPSQAPDKVREGGFQLHALRHPRPATSLLWIYVVKIQMPESDLGMQETHTAYYETMYDSFVQNDLRGKPLLLARYTPTDPHQRSRQRSMVIRNLVAVDGDDVLDEDSVEYERTSACDSPRGRGTYHEGLRSCQVERPASTHQFPSSANPHHIYA